MLFEMGIVKMSNVRDYSPKETYFELTAVMMSRKRFQLLHCFLHFMDNAGESVDRSDSVLSETFLKCSARELFEGDSQRISID